MQLTRNYHGRATIAAVSSSQLASLLTQLWLQGAHH